MDIILEIMAKAIRSCYGFVPEAYLIHMLLVCTFLVLVAREYMRNKIDDDILHANTNRLGVWFGFLCIAGYFILLLISPVWFDTTYGLGSDSVIFTFRIFFTMLFFIYFVFLMIDGDSNQEFYTFEYYFILLVAMMGLNAMPIATNFFNLLIFMELYAISMYYLINNKRWAVRTLEASFKYFIISSVSTALFIMGILIIYLSKGSISFKVLEIVHADSYFCALGYEFIIISLCVKIGAGLFFFWLLDAYEGANFSILMFLNIFVKPVFILVLFKIIIHSHFPLLFWSVKVFLFSSIIIGACGAALNTQLKRFLIFTSIYNIGFFSCFFWDPFTKMLAGFLIFFLIYGLNTLAVFILLSRFRNRNGELMISDIKELSSVMPQNPRMAVGLIFFLFIITGLPPFSFFFVKYLLFVKFTLHINWVYLFFLLLTAAISAFYYFRLIRILLVGTKYPTIFISFRNRGVAFFLALFTIFNVGFLFFSEAMIDSLTLILSG